MYEILELSRDKNPTVIECLWLILETIKMCNFVLGLKTGFYFDKILV